MLAATRPVYKLPLLLLFVATPAAVTASLRPTRDSLAGDSMHAKRGCVAIEYADMRAGKPALIVHVQRLCLTWLKES